MGFWSSNLKELIFKFNLQLHQELHPSNVDTENVIKSAMAYIPEPIYAICMYILMGNTMSWNL
jgi:hypothetical protein